METANDSDVRLRDDIERDIDGQITYRAMTEQDADFIYNSWLMSFRKAPENFGVRDVVYFQWRKEQFKRLIERSQVTLAVFAADPWLILGYSVVAAPVLHYVYVRLPFRSLGIAKRLVDRAFPEGDAVLCSHMTRAPAIEKLVNHLQRRGFDFLYDPRLKEAA